MALTPQQARAELARRELAKREASGTLGKINNAALNTVHAGLEAVAAPFELVGEALRVPIEQGDGFRAPSIVQRFAPSTKTEKPPETPFSLTNKLLRGAAGAVSGIPGGTPMESARAAYNADRGVMGAIEDTALGVLSGKISPAVANAPTTAMANVPSVVKKAVGATGKKAIRVGLGVPEQAQSARFNRPEALKNAKDEAVLAEDVARGHKVIESKIKNIETEVDDVLRSSPYLNEGAIPKDDVRNAVKIARKKIGFTVTPKEEYAKKILDGIDENLKNLHETVSEKQLRDIVQKLDDAVQYGKKEYGTTDIALMGTRRNLDKHLKKNTAYKELMKQEVPLQRLKENVVDQFGLDRSVGEGFIPSTRTESKIKTLAKSPKGGVLQKTAKRLTGVTGQDYLKDIEDLKMSREFIPGERSRGSARTVLGAILGGGIGGMTGDFMGGTVGSTVGAGLGRTADYYGGSMAGKLIDTASKGSTKVSELLNAVKHGARKTEMDVLLELIKQNAPAISGLRSGYQR